MELIDNYANYSEPMSVIYEDYAKGIHTRDDGSKVELRFLSDSELLNLYNSFFGTSRESFLKDELDNRVEVAKETMGADMIKSGMSQIKDVGQELVGAATILLMPVEADRNSAKMPAGWTGKVWNEMIKKPHSERVVLAGVLMAMELNRVLV